MSMFQISDRFRVKRNGLEGTIVGIDGFYNIGNHYFEYTVRWDHVSGFHKGYKEDDVKDEWEKIYVMNKVTSPLPTGVNTNIGEAPFCTVDLKDVKVSCAHDWRSSSTIKGKTKWCAVCDERE